MACPRHLPLNYADGAPIPDDIKMEQFRQMFFAAYPQMEAKFPSMPLNAVKKPKKSRCGLTSAMVKMSLSSIDKPKDAKKSSKKAAKKAAREMTALFNQLKLDQKSHGQEHVMNYTPNNSNAIAPWPNCMPSINRTITEKC
uniref:DRBM domain-containing protein n=1 Tax=Panagrellus redivivus TaxID=6233 RepID=A0A7E4ZV05_PANRE